MAKRHDHSQSMHHHTGTGMVYGLGLIGAAVYYVQHATGFWMGVVGILKAIVWPAMLTAKDCETCGAAW